jgi:tetratricopeptide (TPR) repeat protein
MSPSPEARCCGEVVGRFLALLRRQSQLSFAVVLVAALSTGCAHANAARNRYIHGRPPEYSLPPPATAGTVAPDPAAVRRLAAEAKSERTAAPTAETADAVLKEALAAAATSPTGAKYRRAAGEYLRVGITDLAAKQLSAAIALDPRDAASYEVLARIWRDWGFPAQGLADAHRAVFYAPTSPTAENTLGTLFHRLGRYVVARQHYERALALDARAAYALNNLCALSLDEADAARALTSCQQALAVEPGLAAAARNLETARRLTGSAERKDDHERR